MATPAPDDEDEQAEDLIRCSTQLKVKIGITIHKDLEEDRNNFG